MKFEFPDCEEEDDGFECFDCVEECTDDFEYFDCAERCTDDRSKVN